MRICSLLPSATEILYALGLGEQVVAVSHECDYPPQVRQKPRVLHTGIDQTQQSSGEITRLVRAALAQRQQLYDIDLETLAALRPDLVITQSLCPVCAIDTRQVDEALRQLPTRPQVMTLHPHTLRELFDDVARVGEATGRTAQAHQFLTQSRERVERVAALLQGIVHRPRVFCLEWMDPPMATGHWVPEMVERAGGEEVLGRAGEPSRTVTWDDVVAASPEVLLLMPCGFPIERTRQELSLLSEQPAWSRIPAVFQHQVYLVDGPAYFNRAGPRLVDGIELLAGLLHPERCDVVMPCGGIEPL